jgi:hypothetical protein
LIRRLRLATIRTRKEGAAMNGKRLVLVLVTGALLLAGCASTAAAPGESPATGQSPAATTTAAPAPASTGQPTAATGRSAAIGQSVTATATATATYAPFTVTVGPPTKDAAAVVTVQTEVDGSGFIPPLVMAWAKTGSRLYVTTYGSQTCPEVVDHVSSPGLQRLVLHTSMPFTGTSVGQDGQTETVCTADLSPTTSTVAVPPAINPSVAVLVTINGKAYKLPGRR